MGTNILPDLRERYLQGNIIGGKYLEPGLPNITGQFGACVEESGAIVNGAFRINGSGPGTGTGWTNHRVAFDASWSNPIYGASDTVRPPSMTVLYYIRAK